MLINPGLSIVRPDQRPLVTPQSVNNTTPALLITPNASVNTKGAYVELITSTNFRVKTLIVSLWANSGDLTSFDYLIDIATGGAGSEVVILPNLCVSIGYQYAHDGVNIAFPVNIPAGTRISARCQCIGASGNTATVGAVAYAQGFGANGVDALCSNTATTKSSITITAPNNSYSSWTQCIASTARAYKGLLVLLDTQGASASNWVNCFLDVAMGGAGSEVAFIKGLLTSCPAFGTLNNTGIIWPATIPAGTRLSARIFGQFAVSDPIGVNLYGVY